MVLLDGEMDTVMDLCTIRRPVVWHRDELRSASLMDHPYESHDNSECSYQDDSGSNDADISVDDERSGNNSDSVQSDTHEAAQTSSTTQTMVAVGM